VPLERVRHHGDFTKPGWRARRVRWVHLDMDDRIGHLPLLPFSLVFSQEDTFLPSLPVFQGFLPIFAHSLRIPWGMEKKSVEYEELEIFHMPQTMPNRSSRTQNTSASRIDPRIFLLVLGMFALGTDAFIVAGILPLVSHELGVTENLAGQLVTSFALTYGLGAPILAALTGRWPHVRVLLIALGAFCLFNVGSALAPNFTILFLTRILVGGCAAVFGPLVYVLGVTLAPPEKRGKALALIAGGQSLATVLGSPLGTWIGEHFGWRLSFGLVALLAGIALIMLLLCRLPENKPGPAPTLKARLAPIREPRLVLALLPALLWNLGIYLVYTYIAPLLQQNLHITDVSLFLLAYGLGLMLGNWSAGLIVDRIGSIRPISVFLGVLLIVEPVLAPTTHSVLSALLMLFLWGFCSTMLFTPQQNYLLSLAPEHADVILALNNSTLYLGIGGGAALGGLALRVIAVTQLGLLGAVSVLLALVLFAFSVRLNRRKKETHESEKREQEEVRIVPE
jgi:MFS transporter, DHA1 family, inner membrane transport protein